MKKIAIMQPYLFPYIGYIQLISAVDKFVIYDDVSFIKQGWINRNRILLNCKEQMFTVPLKNASSFVAINKTEINSHLYPGWGVKFLKTVTQAYSKAPCFKPVYSLVQDVVNSRAHTISELCTTALQHICRYLGITTEFVLSSSVYNNHDLKAQARVIDICLKEGAHTYINAIGGMELYSKEDFTAAGLVLQFIKPLHIPYRQFNCNFAPWLSIIDVLMFNEPADVSGLLRQYEIK